MGHFWHPFADMRAVSERGELVLERGDGYYVFDVDGRRYLDATASLWYCNVGHGQQAIVPSLMERARANYVTKEIFLIDVR